MLKGKGKELETLLGFKPLALAMENQKKLFRDCWFEKQNSVSQAPEFIHGVPLSPFPLSPEGTPPSPFPFPLRRRRVDTTID